MKKIHLLTLLIAATIVVSAQNVGIGTNAPTEKLTVQTLNNNYGISHRGEGGNILATYIGGSSAEHRYFFKYEYAYLQ